MIGKHTKSSSLASKRITGPLRIKLMHIPEETLLGIPLSSIVTVCIWTLHTLYGPDAWRNNLVYLQFASSSAASDALVAKMGTIY